MEANEVFEKVKGLFIDDLGIAHSKVTMDGKLEEDCVEWKYIEKFEE